MWGWMAAASRLDPTRCPPHSPVMAKKAKKVVAQPYPKPPNPYVHLRAKTVPDARKEASREACRQASARARGERDR